ncbi:MAG: peptidylprolyl isomerase [Rhodospirillales bacterium]|nr:peptidylprolyl isomerase [Rhodospirillales bacterium]
MLSVICIVTVQPKPATSQATLNIAAIVNDDVISVYDLSQRILLVTAFSNLPNTQQTHQRIAPDVLRRLISEKLRLQEAKRLEIEIEDARIDASIAEIEKKRGIPPGQMSTALEQRGIDPETLRQQVKAELAWVDIVRALFRRLVTISEQEVDDVLQEMQENAGKPEYLLSEIFLAYDEQSRAEVKNQAQQLLQQIKSGASWREIAVNFSESISARSGGDVGWVAPSSLDPALGNSLRNLKVGQVSQPITTDEGVYLLLVRDTRIAEGIGTAKEEVTLGLHQLHLAVPQNASPQAVAQATQNARQLAAGASSCESFAGMAETQGSPSSGYLGEFKLDQLSQQFRNMVAPLNVNEVSQPLRTADGVIVLMVCSRQSESGQDPVAEARAEIERQILNRRLGRMADQHEEKLRRQAFIDIRL